MGLVKYKVLNPVKDTKLPFLDEKKGIFYIPNIKTAYRYYVECVVPDGEGAVDYYLLLSKVKFDINCRLCHTDNYGRVQVKVKGELKDYIIKESLERGNVTVTYSETVDDYEVFVID